MSETNAAPSTEAKQPKAKKEKAPKPPKAPVAPKPPKPVETAEQALARLKADPKTKAKYRRVTEILEMGKSGPVRVTILTDDKGPNGEDQFRVIKSQDLFQVKLSVEGQKAEAKKKRNKAATNRRKASKPAAAATQA